MTVDFTVKYKQKNDILVYNCHVKRLAFSHILRYQYILKTIKQLIPRFPFKRGSKKYVQGVQGIFLFVAVGGGGPCLFMRIF